MSTLTIRLAEEKHARLRQLAEAQGLSMNRLIDELAAIALAQFAAEIRFRARAGSAPGSWAEQRRDGGGRKFRIGERDNLASLGQTRHTGHERIEPRIFCLGLRLG
jgi:hypothetical protein